MKRLFLFLFLAAFARAENLYVTPTGAGSTNGTSWANAFAGFSDVAWGTGTGLVGAGDTLYVGAGTYSGALSVGASGTSTTNRVTIQAAQDTQTGTATLSGAINYNQRNYVTINGLFNGVAQFVIPSGGWVAMPGSGSGSPIEDPKLIGVIVQGGSVDCTYVHLGEWAFNSITMQPGSNAQFGVRFNGITNGASYGQSSFHDNILNINGGTKTDGGGPDGLQQCQGMDVYNNVMRSTTAATAVLVTEEHQDVMQNFGTNYTRVYNNEFIDGSDAQVGFDRGGGQPEHIWVYNNVFRRTIAVGGPQFRIYNIPASGAVFNDVHIDNNTFVDASRSAQKWAVRVHTGNNATGATNVTFQNNIVYNAGSPSDPAMTMEGISNNWTMSNNLVNAGAHGSTNISGFTNTNGQSGAPQFVSYTEYSNANNWHLAASDTAATGKGINLSARFTTDKDGNTRTVPWSIGAYQSGSGPDITPPHISSASINSAGNQITVNFDEAVDFGSAGSGGFTLTMDGGTSVMTYASGRNSAAAVFNLSRVINAGESGTVSFSAAANTWQDLATPPNALQTIPSISVLNNSTQGPPTLGSATINSAGNQIALVFNQPVQAGSGGNAGWTLNVTPAAALGTVTGVGSNTLTYNLTRVINTGESVTLSYTQPGNGIESVSSGADLVSLSNGPVTNNSTQGQTAVPQITLPAGPYFGTQTTTITDSDSGAGAVIRYTVDGSAPTASSPVYSGPITISSNQTIQAIATWAGHLNSAPASSAYEVVSWVTVGTAWKTFTVSQKTGTFTWNLSITAPAAGSDCVVGLGPTAVSDYPGLACSIQFSGNTINGRAGGAYTIGPAYNPGAVYNFVATINVSAHTWSLNVTPAAGGATTTILTNAAFRTEQASAAQLSWVGMQAISGTLAVSNMSFPSGPSSARYIGLRGVPASGGATP